ncbi:MAG: LuxR C-terminal-related transcriptional regulator [Caldilineaceae bacterium]
MSNLLLPTKLYAPPARAHLLHRPALFARLNHEELRPLTLIAAPAGFGKTTLVAEWMAQNKQPVAWLSLEDDDNEVGRFLTYLVAALRTLTNNDLGQDALAMLQSPQPPPVRSILHTLAHELIRDLPPSVLVLDDYHVINAQPIHNAVLFLLEHVPILRWIINTRVDPALPLGRLRARQQLLELRAADLRFSEGETSQLLNEIMQLALTVQSVQELHAKTEGWIAGLQLASLAMQGNPARSDFIHDFYGSHRYIADYLADEVLNHLPDHLQEFLLHTSILERMCAELCNAVNEDQTLPAQTLLEELERANLFLIPLDGDRHWYRYHHLFADLLRQRLQHRQPQRVAELHRRAATWLAANGFLDDAIRHLIAGKALPQAADLLEQNHETLWMQGRVATLHHWLSFLPAELLADRPRLLLAQVWTHVLSDADATVITALFQQIEAALAHAASTQAAEAQKNIRELRGVLAAIRAVYHSKHEESAAVIANAEQALADLPASIGSWRSIALMCLGFAHEMKGDVNAAETTFVEAIRLCQRIGNHYSAFVTARSLARTYLTQGKLHLAAATYRDALDQATQHGIGQLPHTAHVHINLGRLHYEWNDLEAAAAQLQMGIERHQDQAVNWIQIEAYLLLARVRWVQGEVATAEALIGQAEQLAQTSKFEWIKVATASSLVTIRLLFGQDEGGEQWLVQAQPQWTDELNRISEGEHLSAARVLIHQHRTAEALSFLVHITQEAERSGRMKAVVESGVLAALAYQLQGERQSAKETLLKVLILAELEGYLRTFVDEGEAMRQLLIECATWLGLHPNTAQNHKLLLYVDKVLTAFPQAVIQASEGLSTQKSKTQPLVEPLSDRELELLHLMAAGLSNQEIAERLIITLGTVKSHANHIFGKLGVQGRVKAINQARELALI